MPQAAPKITVLMTVFNGERYLAEAIDSILAQTMPDFELVVVDDVSTDGTAELLDAYTAQDSRVRCIKNAQNSGPYPSANGGLEEAAAPLIARMDADDVSEPDRLERQLAFMEAHSDCLLVGGGYHSIDENGDQRFTRENAMDFDTCAFVTRLRMPMVHPSFCFRARLPDGSPVRYDQEIPIAGDYALAAKLASEGKTASLDKLLVRYRMHSENISSTKLDRQRHYAHATATAAVAGHYPADIARDLQALLDVHYKRTPAAGSLLGKAISGINRAIAYDLNGGDSAAMRERAAGILAETFAKQMPLAFATKAAGFLPDVLKRYARLRGWAKPLPFNLPEA